MILVYIAASLDGYIADRDGGLDFLSSVPVPEGEDLGFSEVLASVDGLLMGRITYETVRGFRGPWPYPKPVFVLSSTPVASPRDPSAVVHGVAGDLESVLADLRRRGIERLYIDGGKVVQGFLRRDLVDELVITRIPVLLGGGVPLFSTLPGHLAFDHVETDVLAGHLVRSRYRRSR